MYGVALALSGAGLYRVLFQIPSSSGMGTSRSAGAPAARQYSGRITPPADVLGGALVGVDQDTRDPAAQKALDKLRAAIGRAEKFPRERYSSSFSRRRSEPLAQFAVFLFQCC